ncbi:uncharacterized protein LOC119837407 isoform X3 [Zerene cesonia]|uniref:uncharacterized protein LOC119837407 isoform X3 n=1 Tax=Zerene cesonia TaxID=33412 RepID=UPI0018E56DA8|nr:uncharacterized protein LOC119837407 isoform X3 [Zerene cesonia]
MLMKRNILECITIVSCSTATICTLLNYATNISPLTGWWFIIYTLFLFIFSVIFSFKVIQWILHLNKPIKYDIENIADKYPFAHLIANVLPKIPKKSKPAEVKEYDTNEISVITTVLERKLVSSWYIHYISQEISFPFACKQLLDQMVSKAFQICNKIETKDVYVHICAVLVSHIKEYKKAIKRQEKTPSESIETLYKKSHPIFDTKCRKTLTADHCINIIRIILKELVPWELWDTPNSELLIRILAKKLDTFIDTTIADPIWLNNEILALLTSSSSAKSTDGNTEAPNKPECPDGAKDINDIEAKVEEPEDVGDVPKSDSVIEPAKKEEIKNDKCVEEKEIAPISEPVEIKPVLRQRRGRQGKNEVKIYDRIIEGKLESSVKTWETDMDLQCISMGQDLLASLDELTLSRLWGHEDTEHSPNLRAASPQPLWFGEEDAIELDPEPHKETKSSPKATDALLKDLQSTVHQAKTKIGDLQDEAAGMMEGLFDKGIAGIKKGLRFTGLSDDSMEKSPSHNSRDKSDKASPPETYKQKGRLEMITEHRDIKDVNSTHKDDGNSVPPLVKQQRVTSQDSTMQSKPKLEQQPFSLSDSPEPQYEETADLSHTIAKLRSLLNEATPRNEDIWWDSAEETRGRTHLLPSPSPRNVDTATLADEYDMSLERNASPGQISNNMQRLDRLFQRTVTGVFNSIKTAVGAEGEGEGAECGGEGRWHYVCTSMEISVCGAVARLVGARRALAHVDAALDSLQQLPPARAPHHAAEDFEEWCATEGARWCGSLELACALGLAPHHVTFRLASLLLADVAETLICGWLEELTMWVRKQVFDVFESMSEAGTEPVASEVMRELNVDETVQVIMEKMPETYIFGEESLRQALLLLLTSFTNKNINKDVTFRMLDVFAAHFKKSAGLRNPSFDNN